MPAVRDDRIGLASSLETPIVWIIGYQVDRRHTDDLPHGLLGVLPAETKHGLESVRYLNV